MVYFWVGLGGAFGSMARYAVGVLVGRWLGAGFPWATLLINVGGSFLIGALAESFALRWDTSQLMRAFLIVGVCGGYTTFSTFSLDIVTLVNRGANVAAMLYAVGSVVLALAGLYAGLQVMRGALS